MFLTLVLICIISYILLMIYKSEDLDMKDIPKIKGPRSLPIIGNILQIENYGKGPFLWVVEMQKKYGYVFKYQRLSTTYVCLSDPKDVEGLLSSVKHIEKSGSYKLVEPWIGNGLVCASGGTWKEQRKIITPSFHFNNFSTYLHVFNEQTKILMDILQEKAESGENFDITPICHAYSLDVICECAMGAKIKAQTEKSPYFKATEDITNIISNRRFHVLEYFEWTYWMTAAYRRQIRALKVIHSLTDEFITQRREKLVNSTDQKTDINHNGYGDKTLSTTTFMDILLQTKHSDGEPLTDTEIRAQVNTFTFGGSDTTAAAMCFLFYHLSENPHIQEKILEEQYEILGHTTRPAKFHELSEMNYLDCVIKESLRLKPSAPSFSRRLNHDLQISTNNYVIPAGVNVNVLVYQLHRHPDVYPNPEVFDPARFLPENTKTRSPYAFIPFSAGPRNCIAQKFAFLEIKSTISTLLRSYEIFPAILPNGEKPPVDISATITLGTSSGINIRVRERK